MDVQKRFNTKMQHLKRVIESKMHTYVSVTG